MNKKKTNNISDLEFSRFNVWAMSIIVSYLTKALVYWLVMNKRGKMAETDMLLLTDVYQELSSISSKLEQLNVKFAKESPFDIMK